MIERRLLEPHSVVADRGFQEFGQGLLLGRTETEFADARSEIGSVIWEIAAAVVEVNYLLQRCHSPVVEVGPREFRVADGRSLDRAGYAGLGRIQLHRDRQRKPESIVTGNAAVFSDWPNARPEVARIGEQPIVEQLRWALPVQRCVGGAGELGSVVAFGAIALASEDVQALCLERSQ